MDMSGVDLLTVFGGKIVEVHLFSESRRAHMVGTIRKCSTLSQSRFSGIAIERASIVERPPKAAMEEIARDGTICHQL